MDVPIYRFPDMIDYFDRKGITYNLTHDEIISFLSNNNYFFKLREYKIFCVNRKFHVKRKTLSW